MTSLGLTVTSPDMQRSPTDMQRSPTDMQRSPTDMQRSPSDMHRSPTDMQRSPTDMQRSPADMQRSPRSPADLRSPTYDKGNSKSPTFISQVKNKSLKSKILVANEGGDIQSITFYTDGFIMIIIIKKNLYVILINYKVLFYRRTITVSYLRVNFMIQRFLYPKLLVKG